jgi:hypothetical protein
MYLPEGIDWHGGYIYHVKNSDFTFYKTTETGSLVATFRCYPYTTRPRDIAATDNYLWIINEPAPVNVYRFTTSGSFLNSFNVQETGATGYGITAAGPYVYVSFRDVFYYFNTYTTTGSLVATFRSELPKHKPGPLDYDGTYFYTGEVSRIRKWTTGYTGYIYTGGYYYDGISCQGSYFWFADYNKSYVYKIGGVTTDIAPSSLGRVKALFR